MTADVQTDKQTDTKNNQNILSRPQFGMNTCLIITFNYNMISQFFTGWAIASEERDWKYRLSVYYTKPQDSGTFTCATPRGITNSITLHVIGNSL